MFGTEIGPGEIVLVLLIALLVFGPSKLPQIGAGLGKSIRDFKKAMAEASDDAPSAVPAKQLPEPPAAGTVATAAPTEEKKA